MPPRIIWAGFIITKIILDIIKIRVENNIYLENPLIRIRNQMLSMTCKSLQLE